MFKLISGIYMLKKQDQILQAGTLDLDEPVWRYPSQHRSCIIPAEKHLPDNLGVYRVDLAAIKGPELGEHLFSHIMINHLFSA